MKIQILSDLHLEFDLPSHSPDVQADLVILAGDIHNGGAGIFWAGHAFSARTPVIYVPGNHEYYGPSMNMAQQEMKRATAKFPDHVHLLDRGELVLSELGVRVLGATLWTDFSLFGRSDRELNASIEACERYMNDYNGAIQLLGENGQLRRFKPLDALALHQADLAWLKEKLACPFEGETIVVTHHAPHPNSLADRFATDRVSAGFINDLTDLMGSGIDLWVHGHNHDSFDYEVKGTRVICNPRGYVNRRNGKIENPEFDWSLVVNI